ncbi:MAG: hypothetical protein JSS35_07510 [Proteobacteria bacterium]|nr:hypothetical protein [Pseudomonadota bacterium]
MIAAAAYVLVAAGFSVAPIRQAIVQARATPIAPPPLVTTISGPIPEAPDTGPVRIAKAIGRQAAIVLGPPARALWFGWDLWFTLVGFFPGGRRPAGD